LRPLPKPQHNSESKNNNDISNSNNKTDKTRKKSLPSPRDTLGSCPGKLRHCPTCSRTSKSIGRLIDNPDGSLYAGKWCKTLQCMLCNQQWHVCTDCSQIKQHLIDNKLLRLHYRRCHILDYAGETVNARRLRLPVKRLGQSNSQTLSEQHHSIWLSLSSDDKDFLALRTSKRGNL
jgi:hypothetical protein